MHYPITIVLNWSCAPRQVISVAVGGGRDVNHTSHVLVVVNAADMYNMHMCKSMYMDG